MSPAPAITVSGAPAVGTGTGAGNAPGACPLAEGASDELDRLQAAHATAVAARAMNANAREKRDGSVPPQPRP